MHSANVRQADDVDNDTHARKVASARKAFEERVGMKMSPKEWLQSEKTYEEAKEEADNKTTPNANKLNELKNQCWDELVAMMASLGINDTKFGSMKTNSRHQFGQGHDICPKDPLSLKTQLNNRKWDETPTESTTQNTSNKDSDEKKKNNHDHDMAKQALTAAGALPSADFHHKANKERRCHCCGHEGPQQ